MPQINITTADYWLDNAFSVFTTAESDSSLF